MFSAGFGITAKKYILSEATAFHIANRSKKEKIFHTVQDFMRFGYAGESD
jgi:hypothetical protein